MGTWEHVIGYHRMYSQHSGSFLDVYVKQQDGVAKPIKGLDSTQTLDG